MPRAEFNNPIKKNNQYFETSEEALIVESNNVRRLQHFKKSQAFFWKHLVTSKQGGSVRPKPLFWFRSNTETETQIGWYFRPIL